MNQTMKITGMAAMAGLLLTAFTSGINNRTKQEPQKTRHIKMIKIENGKKMELDTVLTNDDVFIWHGDTLNPTRLIENQHVEIDRIRGNERVFIKKLEKGKSPMEWNQNSGGELELITEDLDSLGETIVIRKRIRDGIHENRFNTMEHRMRDFPPMPPMPPTPPSHLKMLKHAQSGQFINLNDPNVVSFKKKDLKGGLEKIEIIRKKTDEQENISYDFQFDEPMWKPGREGDFRNMKIIKKEMKLKDEKGQEIEVEIETEDTK